MCPKTSRTTGDAHPLPYPNVDGDGDDGRHTSGPFVPPKSRPKQVQIERADSF